VTLATSLIKIFYRGHLGIVHWSNSAQFEFRGFTLTEILAFNTQNLRGHVTLVTIPFTLFWHLEVGSHQAKPFELRTAIIGSHTTSEVTRNTLDCDQSVVYSSRVVFSAISYDLLFVLSLYTVGWPLW